MYKNLESRIFDSLKLQSSQVIIFNNNLESTESEQQDLYMWTINAYSILSDKPELLMKNTNEDDAHPYRFNCAAYGKPQLKKNMRKALTEVINLMKWIWSCTVSGEIYGETLLYPASTKLPSKYLNVLKELQIEIKDNTLRLMNYNGAFMAMKALSRLDDGFDRMIRGIYDTNSILCTDLFKHLSDDNVSYKKLVKWLLDNKYNVQLNLNASEVRDFEGIELAFIKNTNGEQSLYQGMYEHEHIGVVMSFSSLLSEQASFSLLIQEPRQVLNNFNDLSDDLKQFLINYHSGCNICGYCTQRQKGKNKNAKPYTIAVKYEGENHPMCPINHVYTYCWNTLSEDLVNGMINYLKHLEILFKL